MQFGISLPGFGAFGDVRYLVQTAVAAEAAGWDGFFLWDHIIFDPTFHPMVDPWIALAAIALAGALAVPAAAFADEKVSAFGKGGGKGHHGGGHGKGHGRRQQDQHQNTLPAHGYLLPPPEKRAKESE